MRLRVPLAVVIAIVATLTVAYADSDLFQVKPANFDPAHTFLVQSTWLTGIGCPTNPRISLDGKTTVAAPSDPACTTGDARDKHNEGLLLVKTGPTGNYAAATATLTGAPSHVTELGFDIRKNMTAASLSGSHCGAGAPRFDLTTSDGTNYFIGCNSPPAVVAGASSGWVRLRWSGPVMAYGPLGLVDVSAISFKSISIVLDEGQDASGGPDSFGAAILDNIDVNGTLVGQGPHVGDDTDKGNHNDGGSN